MDRPLLALTRSRLAPDGPATETTATQNLRQLIQLRWIAVAGQLVTILAVRIGLGVPLPLVPMLAVVALLGLVNVGAARWLARHDGANLHILLALLFDTFALSAQLYFSGGASNPFISLFLLQGVLGAILLEGRWVWVLVAVSSLCYAGLAVFGRPLAYPARLSSGIADLYRLGAWISFVLIGVLLALFITRIIRNLRARDAYLAELRRHAVEEDSIVRMGLFASGAAHELGTPLASLSVILNDWRRMPKLTGDPTLAEELDVMEAELQRCKSIVTAILESAGEPRGEAMNRVSAHRFIDDLAVAWGLTHPKLALKTRYEGSADAVTVASPALRQAIWNVLDNAAEVSPAEVSLHVAAGPDGLVVSVADQGPGFATSQLADIGKPHHSTKGPGHGVGLFLAASTARKFGGRLEASNPPGGGALVRLILPMADSPKEAG